MLQFIRPSLAMMLLFTILTGLIYPFAILGIGQAAFPAAANGNLVSRNGVVVGSALIGQAFDGSVMPLSAGYAGAALFALGCVLVAEKGRLFQGINPPVR